MGGCRWISPLAMVLTVVMAHSAAAESARDKATRLARKAAVLVEQGRLEEALELFEKAYQLDPAPILLGHMGKVYEKQGDLTKAREMYERWVSNEMDSERLARGRELLEDLLDRIPGRLVVTASPAGAKVEVNGQPVDAGRAVELRRGTYEVEVTLQGHAPAKHTIEVSPGEERRLTVQLVALPGWLEVRGTAGARITVNGKDPRILPLEQPYVLPPGLHVVEVTAEGYEKWVKTVEVKPDSRLMLDAMLVVLPRKAEPSPVEEVAKTAEVRRSWWPWVCIGTGAAALVTGGVMSGLAYRERGKVSGASQEGGVVTGLSMTDAASHVSKAKTYDQASYAMYVLGGATVVAGVVLWVVQRTSKPIPGAPVAVASPVPGGMAVSAAWRF